MDKELTMKIREVLQDIKKVKISHSALPVEKTVAREMCAFLSPEAKIVTVHPAAMKSEPGTLVVAIASQDLREQNPSIPHALEREWVFFSCGEKKCCWLICSKPYFLYAAFSYLVENLIGQDATQLRHWAGEISFGAEKSTFDLFLTQYARLIRNFSPERYVREYARLGFTHVEVNALAWPFPYEKGVHGEFYADFYTYCPGLDQYVSSHLNEGLYPKDYLAANLNLLKQNARQAVDYGLIPGLLCFEPRSVPESFFQRYPTLRGARVDHPFRSYKPRYNLSVIHPAVREHYAELMSNLMAEVPELGFLSVWSNDSGAGFEHTKSLYVGRNGGAFLIREWKDDARIAEAAASNIISFFRVLQDAASRVNPQFRITTRLESFYGEREYIWPQLKHNIDVEGHSLLTKGWESNSPHPMYADVNVLGSALHNTLHKEEEKPLQELRSRGSLCFYYHSFSCHTNHEPLLGIPFPWLTHEKLLALYTRGVTVLAHLGGLQPPDKVPFSVNQEVFRRFQFAPGLDIDKTLLEIAESYTGGHGAEDLVRGWRLMDRAIRSFVPLSIYTHYGTVWQRLLVRPLVPDIDRIPERQREYYEKHMCTSLHNPNRVDLARDVLFELLTKEYAHMAFQRIDDHVWEPLDAAIALFRNRMVGAETGSRKRVFQVFQDQWVRTRALRCLFKTLRNTAVWIYSVHEYITATDDSVKKRCRTLLDEMIDSEIKNCKQLLQIWSDSPVEWIIVSGNVETPFIHGDNFGDLLEKKIDLMHRYRNHEPRIDPDYMFRLPAVETE
jgi:hypothetical protein